ncbi:MAG: hypothetical protein RL701_6480, partial [Pseudomonadota bacterium]
MTGFPTLRSKRSPSWELYDWLLARVASPAAVSRVLLGMQWGVAESQADSQSSKALGLCFSPVDVPRTLPWPGTLVGRTAIEVSHWLRSFDAAEACVALATLNSVVNAEDNPCSARAEPLSDVGPQHLRVFSHFAPQLTGAKIAVVGRYPGLEQVFSHLNYSCLERRPNADTLPDSACEYVLPEADVVFLTASAIANKTLPRLLELSQHATVILMGPSLPWLADWADFGVDYLAGVVVKEPAAVWQVAAEGGGIRLFESAVEYR